MWSFKFDSQFWTPKLSKICYSTVTVECNSSYKLVNNRMYTKHMTNQFTSVIKNLFIENERITRQIIEVSNCCGQKYKNCYMCSITLKRNFSKIWKYGTLFIYLAKFFHWITQLIFRLRLTLFLSGQRFGKQHLDNFIGHFDIRDCSSHRCYTCNCDHGWNCSSSTLLKTWIGSWSPYHLADKVLHAPYISSGISHLQVTGKF